MIFSKRYWIIYHTNILTISGETESGYPEEET